MDFKPSNGFYDLCINVSNEDAARFNSILLRLYKSKFIAKQRNKKEKKLTSVFIYL